MPTTYNCSVIIEYSLNPTGYSSQTFYGANWNDVIAQVKAVVNFKHVDSWMVLTYAGIPIKYPILINNIVL